MELAVDACLYIYMKNYKIIVQYDGTRYKGWQVQKSTDMTIQGKIQAVDLPKSGNNGICYNRECGSGVCSVCTDKENGKSIYSNKTRRTGILKYYKNIKKYCK